MALIGHVKDLMLTGPSSPLSRYGKQRREMTGKYRARNPALVAALMILDLLGSLHPRRKGPLPIDRPIRILICNWAHLGDVVAVLPLLQFLSDHPRVGKIGILAGSWSACIVSDLPFVDNVHYLDHFLLDRTKRTKLEKIRGYFVRQRKVVSEIRSYGYDASIDLFPVVPATHRLTWKAGIPVRIGFYSSGLGTYLTHPVSWPRGDEYILTKQLQLLRPILGTDTPEALPAVYPNFMRSNLAERGLAADRRYVLIHMGVGDYRSWPLANWLELGHALKRRGREIVFTGAKGREAEMAADVAKQLSAQSVAGALSWNEFVNSVANAAVVISVDTVTGHLAACFGNPSIIVLSGRWGTRFFRPNNVKAVTLTHPVGCAPCYRSTGCPTMACIQYISVAEVLCVFDQITANSQQGPTLVPSERVANPGSA
jgi:ADP-heptose:LPS heptosyltransferase